MAKEPKSESKQYGLKPLEMRMLEVMRNRHQEEFGNFLTFVATERLAYKVTANTQFSVDNEKLIITEVEPEEEKVATA